MGGILVVIKKDENIQFEKYMAREFMVGFGFKDTGNRIENLLVIYEEYFAYNVIEIWKKENTNSYAIFMFCNNMYININIFDYIYVCVVI